MERQNVRSSNIASIGYDESSETLEIEFNRGGIYQYSNVPLSVYNRLMIASSHGVFFAAHIKDSYSSKKQ